MDKKILFFDTALSLRQKLESITYPLVRNVVAVFANGRTPESKPQNEEVAEYYSRRTPADGKIRWSMTDLEIHDLIRALVHPWPGAFLELPNNQTLIVDSYKSLEEVVELRSEYQE